MRFRHTFNELSFSLTWGFFSNRPSLQLELMAPENLADTNDKAEWPFSVSSEIIRICHEHKLKGDLTTTTFNKKSWKDIGDELAQKTNRTFTLQQMKQKFNRLRMQFRILNDLKNCTGFGWDPVKKTVTADDATWSDHLKRYPKAGKYREKGLEHYELLAEIFNVNIASGGLGYMNGDPLADSDEDRAQKDNCLNAGLNDISDSMTTEGNGGGKRRRAMSQPAEGRKKLVDKMDSLVEMASVVMSQRVAKVVEQSATSNAPPPDPFSIAECIRVAEAMSLDNQQFVKLMKLIPQSEYRQMFMLMSDEHKIVWLNSL